MAHRRDLMRTFNPCYDYSFSWTVENFHLLLPTGARGPAFSLPIPGCKGKVCFGVVVRNFSPSCHLDFNIIKLDNNFQDPIHVRGKITIKNMEEELSDLKTFPYKNFKTVTTLYSFSNSSFKKQAARYHYIPLIPGNFHSFGLADGQVIFEGMLTFSCYGNGIESSIFSISDRNCEELSENLKTMFESGLASDVTFTVGGEKLRAHKAILVARSEVFAKMFQHDMLENKTNNVTIEDADYSTFYHFLLYLYTGILDVAENHFFSMQSLYSVAQKYQVKGLHKTCVAHLARKLSVHSVCECLVLADLHGDEEFKGIVKTFLRDNIFSVVGTLNWTKIVATKPGLSREVLDFVNPMINNQ